MKGIVLYGPPASGKSTTTAALAELDPRFVLLRKLKAGNQRGTEYDFVDAELLAQLRSTERLLVETHRYGNTYAIDRGQVEQLVLAGQVPIVHMGNIPDIRRLVAADPWLLVLLWVSREICEQRSRHRGDSDTAKRLKAWDETMEDLQTHGRDVFSLAVHTDQATPEQVARRIADAFMNSRLPL
ncbi:guanylate kinase [Nonomuraea sp. NN258]|uniref:guanylate kinase n=1 Tax=Nonomuraea antri TaxID=2730852 RepID=UPI001568768D|nr:guanylate kinase [Nonomuraea antri]NRQ36629.1 guanylate kinase [Nonomuraea antri]